MYKEEFGEPYDYEERPQYIYGIEQEKKYIENEIERRLKNGE